MAGIKDKNVFSFLKNKSNRREKNIQFDSSYKKNDSSSECSQEPKDCKQRRLTLDRRESGRFQSAARILRSLRRGDDSHERRGKENAGSGIDRRNPQYHSEGKGLRKKLSSSDSSHVTVKERSHSFCEKETPKRIPIDKFSTESPILELTAVSNSPKANCNINVLSNSQISDDLYEFKPLSLNSENIYEHVSNLNEEPIEDKKSFEIGNVPAMLAIPAEFGREKERRSARKLTKDSGYETSAYSETDYANIELAEEETSYSNVTDGFMLNGNTPLNPTLPQTNTSEHHLKEKLQSHLSPEVRVHIGKLKKSSFLHTTPAPNSEGSSCSLSTSRSRSQLHKFPSVESLGILPECSVPNCEDISALLPTRSTPSLYPVNIRNNIPYKEVNNGRKLLSSKSTPNLEERKNESMVTNKSSLNPFGHKIENLFPHNSREMYYDRGLIRSESVGQREYDTNLRSSSHQILNSHQSPNGYHLRQHSNGSTYSDDAITDNVSLYRSHNLSEDIHDNNDRYPMNSEGNYFFNWSHQEQELGNIHEPAYPFYNSPQTHFKARSQATSSDHPFAIDHFMTNSSKLHSSPPLPPVRDASSLKYVRYGPGHEKFPSWPVPAGAASHVLSPQYVHDVTVPILNDTSLLSLPQGCQRSHSWTEQSDYPKNDCGSYTRPYMKNNVNQNFQSQLLTVIENCEKIPPELFHPKPPEETYNNHGEIPSYHSDNMVYCPPYDREGRPIDDIDYNIPSPPERDPGMGDINVCRLTSAQLEEYGCLYDLNYEELPYITPFLDQLRHESCVWDENSERDSGRGESEGIEDSSRYSNGRESVTTVITDSSSASSSETIKLHGSFSDISIVSSNSREAKKDPNVAHSSRINAPQKQNSESVLYYETNTRETHEKVAESKIIREQYRNYRNIRSIKDEKWSTEPVNNEFAMTFQKFPSYSYSEPLSQINESPTTEPIKTNNLSFSCPKNHTIDFSKPPSVADRISQLEKQSKSSVNIGQSRSPGNSGNLKDNQMSSENNKQNVNSKSISPFDNQSAKNIRIPRIKHDQSPIQSLPVKFPAKIVSMSRRDAENCSVSSDKYNNSAGDRRPINSAYTYLDPTKKCMVSDSTLKNIQKQALLSFYQRKTGKGSSNTSHHDSANSSTRHATNSNNKKISAVCSKSEDNTRSSENMARIGTVPINNEASHKLHYSNSLKYPDDNKIDNCTINNVLEPSACPQTALPEIQPTPWIIGLSPDRKSPSESEHLSNDDDQDVERMRNEYSIKHSPTSSNLQLKNGNVTTYLLTPNSFLKPPDRPPKNPNLRSNFVNKSHTFDEYEISNGDYKNPKRKSYYYKKPPAPDPSPSPPEDSHPCLLENPPQPKLPLNTAKNIISRAPTPDLPPPPPFREDILVDCDEPLPPPPLEMSLEGFIPENICEEEKTSEGPVTYHKDSYMAHRKDWTTGFEGRYRRTHSPSAPLQRNLQLPSYRDHESSITFRNLQRSAIPPKIPSSTNGESMHMRSSVSTSNLSPVCDTNRDTDVINDNNLCHVSRNLAQSADWSSHNSSVIVTFSSEELKSFKEKKARLQLSAFQKYNANDSRHNHLRDVRGSVQSLASSSDASSSAPSDESRYSSSCKTSLDSLNRPISGRPDFSCHMRPISRSISVGEPQDSPNQFMNIAKPLPIINTTNDKYDEYGDKCHSSPVHLNSLSMNGEELVNHDGPVTAHPAIVTEDSLSSRSVSLRDQMNATSTPKTSPDNSPKTSPVCPISPNSISNQFPKSSIVTQCPTPSYKDKLTKSFEGSIRSTANETVLSDNSVLSSSILQCDRNIDTTMLTTSISSLRHLSPTGTSCSMAAMVIPEGEHIDRSNIVTLSYGRKVSREEVDYEKQSVEFVSNCNYDKQLKTIIAPGKDHKTIASYMQNLFALELRKDLLCLNHSKHPDLISNQNLFSTSLSNNRNTNRASSPIDSTYFMVSDCKTRLLATEKPSSSKATLDVQSVRTKKENLIKSLTNKVDILKAEQEAVKSEISANSDLGLRVTDMIQSRAKIIELNRYKLHVEEIDKIISLLLVLSARLAKVENGLSYFSENTSHIEKESLENKRYKLSEQLEEAKKLKESIDRRAIQVSKFLTEYLNESEFAEYDHYVKMKAKLFMDSREIDEKMRLADEQLHALQATPL